MINYKIKEGEKKIICEHRNRDTSNQQQVKNPKFQSRNARSTKNQTSLPKIPRIKSIRRTIKKNRSKNKNPEGERDLKRSFFFLFFPSLKREAPLLWSAQKEGQIIRYIGVVYNIRRCFCYSPLQIFLFFILSILVSSVSVPYTIRSAFQGPSSGKSHVGFFDAMSLAPPHRQIRRILHVVYRLNHCR